MLTNWHNLSQQLGLPTRKNELWRYSHVKDYIDPNFQSKNHPTNKPEIPDFIQSELIYFNGTEWLTNFNTTHIENKISTPEVFKQDGLYAWYKKQTTNKQVIVTNSKTVTICIPTQKQQLLLPELTLDLSQSEHEVTIYEIHIGNNDHNEMENIHTSIFSLKVINHCQLTYHRFSSAQTSKSISWLDIDNYQNMQCYIWKHHNSQNKEFIHITNKEIQASTELRLIANLSDNSKYDLTTHINHIKENTNSNQLFKCILDKSAQAALTGKIFIDQHCPGTKALFRSKHTLLSKSAHIFSQPQLEIFTDDVECAHGSSTGSLQEEELFYLTSRGVTPSKAKQMLLGAFINDEILSLKNQSEQKFFQGLIL
jgi:Fe-S cluster assembly protein SufD